MARSPSRRHSRCRPAFLAGLVAATLAAVTACSGGSSGSTAGNLKILSITGSQQQALTDLAKKYETAHPGTTVAVEFVPPTSYGQTLLTRLRSGAGPDLFYGNGGTGQPYSIAPLEKAGQIADLTGESWSGSLPKAADPLFRIDGKVWGLPLALVPVGLAYNKAALAKTGVAAPQTFDELLSACKAAGAAGVPMISVAGASPANAGIFAQLIASSTVYSKDPGWNTERASGATTFAGSAAWQTALGQIVQMKDAGCLLPGSEGTQVAQMFSAVATEKAVSLPGPSGVINAVKDSTPSLQFGLLAFPGATAADTRAMIGYSDALLVNAKSPSLPQAKQFVGFMADATNAATYANAGATISLSDAAAGNVPPDVTDFGPYIKNQQTVAIPNLNWVNGDVYSALSSGVQGLLTGQQKPADVLAAMDAAWDKGAPN